ncbi:MAG: metal ABC transporter substrate-binding protein [Spirochaetia bacterium]|nr:metal ABC transporter substrate-binding protein [Spirochaetia bacterium]
MLQHLSQYLFLLFTVGSLLIPFSRICAEKFIVATIHPASAILKEIAGSRITVHTLIRPGNSHHTFDPTPSDMLKMKRSMGIFFISRELDGWAAKNHISKHFEMIQMLPKTYLLELADSDHHHGHNLDPHFWMDPLTVKAILPGLTGALCSIDLSGCRIYSANATRFSKKLLNLDAEIKKKLKTSYGKKFFIYHSSLRYFFKRYGLRETGVLEPVTGSEPTPRHIAKLILLSKKQKVQAILTEELYPIRSAKMLSEQTGLSIVMVDPAGGRNGRFKYEEILFYNADQIAKAVK